MSSLHIFHQDHTRDAREHSTEPSRIAALLNEVGVRFEQWNAASPIEAGASQDSVLAAYRADIDRLINERGYQTVDVISLNASHPDKAALRQKFLSEHTHSEDEVRFFVAGRGLFSLHIGELIFEVLCEKGDLISVPANTRHWFDMGSQPEFVAVRLFNNPEGWVANYTGDAIAERCSRLD